jgi:hypothetical protein
MPFIHHSLETDNHHSLFVLVAGIIAIASFKIGNLKIDKIGNFRIGNFKIGNFKIGTAVILKWNGLSGPP